MAGASTIRRDIWNLPNILTMGRIAVIPLVCWLLWTGSPLDCVLATALFGLASATDWLDGWVARRQNLVSLTGKFLDPLADKLLVMAALVTLVPLHRVSAWIVILILAREITITSLRALAAGEGIIIAAEWGGKWKTACQMVGLVGLMLHYRYTLDFFLFDVSVRFHRVGTVMILLSLYFSLGSAWAYFRDFLRAIEARGATEAGP